MGTSEQMRAKKTSRLLVDALKPLKPAQNNADRSWAQRTSEIKKKKWFLADLGI